MSHFSVLVTGDDIDAAMAPFDENLEVARYLKRTKEQIIADGRRDIEQYRDDGLYAKFVADPKKYIADTMTRHPNSPDHVGGHIAYVAVEFPKKLLWTDEEIYAHEARWFDEDELDELGNEWSERNPLSKWDYWRVGGRWAGHLTLIEGHPGSLGALSWEWKEAPATERPVAGQDADSALLADIDLDKTSATYAIVHDGQWIARAEMGWFGVSYDEECPEDEWPAKWREVVQSLPVDTRLTVVDCHI